jgi:hypothetical protein
VAESYEFRVGPNRLVMSKLIYSFGSSLDYMLSRVQTISLNGLAKAKKVKAASQKEKKE